MRKIKILFICKWNRFRSKAAEAILDKISDGRFEVRSAGIFLYREPFVPKIVISLLKEKNYSVRKMNSVKVDDELIEWAVKIVVVADDVPDIFPKEKTIRWEIKDISDEEDFEGTRRTIEKIEKRVREFLGLNFDV